MANNDPQINPNAALHDTGMMRLKRCRHGMMLYNINDLTVGRALDIYGEFSERETEFLGALVAPGDIVIDVGANIGALTVPLARAVGPEGAVIAFEPQPTLFQTLCANIALNGFLNVRTINGALGAEAGAVRLPRLDFTVPGLYGAHEIGSNEEGDQVQAFKLDEVLALPSCKLLKIDGPQDWWEDEKYKLPRLAISAEIAKAPPYNE